MMAKKRLSKSSRMKKAATSDSKKSGILDSFKKILGIGSAVRNIPLTEKTLLIALLVLMGLVAFTTNSENLNAITGAVIGAQDLNEKISLVISLITDGFAKPVFDLLSPTPNVFFIKLILVILFYFLLSYGAGLRNRLEGKGNVIAGIIALLGAALLPQSFIDNYIVNFIPGLISAAVGVLILFLLLYWLFTREAESRAEHGLKALGFFIAFIVISEIGGMIANATVQGAFFNIMDWITIIAFVFAIIMFIVELVRALSGFGQGAWRAAGRRDERQRGEREAGEDNEDELRPLARNVLDELEELI